LLAWPFGYILQETMRRVYGDRFWYARDYTLIPGHAFVRGEDIEENVFIYLPDLGEIETRDLAFY